MIDPVNTITSNKSLEVMLDIETLGIKSNALVLSIAAVLFDRAEIKYNAKLSIMDSQWKDAKQIVSVRNYKILYMPVSLLECLNAWCTIEQDTAAWWLKQKDRSQLVESMACAETLVTTMTKLQSWLREANYKHIWAKSPSFDITILRSLSESVNIDLGIDFRKECDVRTALIDYPQFDVRKISEKLVITNERGEELKLHNPVYDSIIQLRAVQEVYFANFPN